MTKKPAKKAPAKRKAKAPKKVGKSGNGERDNKGRFIDGHVGYPSPGRPPFVGHVRELAKTHTQDAIDALAAEMHGSPDGRVVVSASQALLDRGWGKPTQHLGGDDSAPPIQLEVTEAVLRAMTKDERASYIHALRAAKARLDSADS